MIPPSSRAEVMEEIHSEHIGICKMKAVARSLVWWPGLDKQLEAVAIETVWCVEHPGRHHAVKGPTHSCMGVSGWPLGENSS